MRVYQEIRQESTKSALWWLTVATVMISACGGGKGDEAKSRQGKIQSQTSRSHVAVAHAAVAPDIEQAKTPTVPHPDPKRASLEKPATQKPVTPTEESLKGQGRPNVPASFNPDIESPQIDAAAYIDRQASVIGHVEIGKRTYVAPFASARGDEGQPIHIGSESNLQDGVVVHALETVEHGEPILKNTYEVNGKRYAVFIGDRVSLAHQSQVHGPAWVEDNVFVGMQALVFKAHIGNGSVIEPGAKVIGVTVPPGCYVSAGSVLTDQQIADNLPKITESYPFRALNDAVVHVNTSLADGYAGRGITEPQHEQSQQAVVPQAGTASEENSSHVVAAQ